MVCCGVDAFNFIKRTHYGSLATINGTAVTLSAPGLQVAAAGGAHLVFLPRTKTGQFVPNWLFTEPGIGGAWAMEADVTVADSGDGLCHRSKYPNTLAEFLAAGGYNAPTSTWISFWLYGQQRALPGQVGFEIHDDSNPEFDVMEQQGHFTLGPADLSSAGHNYLQMRDHANGDNVVVVPAAEGRADLCQVGRTARGVLHSACLGRDQWGVQLSAIGPDEQLLQEAVCVGNGTADLCSTTTSCARGSRGSGRRADRRR